MKLVAVNKAKYWAKVDDEDFKALDEYSWHNHHGYPATKIYTKLVFMHCMIMGNPPAGKEIHHRDGLTLNHGNTINNQRSNLEVIDISLHRHRHKKYMNALGYKGVRQDQTKFRAEIRFKGKPYHLGMFKTIEDAAHAYDKKALEFYGQDAKLNFPCTLHS